MNRSSLHRWMRNLARVGSVLSLATILLFSFGIGHQGWPGWKGLLSLMLFPFGVLIGLVWGWKREALGGGLVLTSFMLYGSWRWFLGLGWPKGWVFPLLVLPGLFFLLSAWLGFQKKLCREEQT
ncbi:MAG: hypothetical protein LWX11_05775 [Firmicutes bacterium]|nr:hypothetical protein [Bacillota bacterium]